MGEKGEKGGKKGVFGGIFMVIRYENDTKTDVLHIYAKKK
jgi:hypothetical protein